MSQTTKEQRFFSQPYNTLQQFPLPHLDIVHFHHNALLAFSALIIDYFMATPSRKFNAAAERLLENLDLLKVYPHYPAAQNTSQHLLTSTHYLHQLCSAATTPTLLLWLMRSISLALKRLCLEEMLQHQDYYHFIYGETLHIDQLNANDPNQINRYASVALRRALGFEFMQSETHDNKKLPRTFHLSKPKASSTGLSIHWEKGECLFSAIVEHGALFKPLMGHENARFLCQELQNYQPNLPITKYPSTTNTYIERCALAKEVFSRLQLSLDDLVKLYSDTLDSLFETVNHHHKLLFLEPHKSHTHRKEGRSQSLSSRLYRELQELLCRLIALEVIPNSVLLNHPSLNKERQHKTFLTQESDNSVMTFT